MQIRLLLQYVAAALLLSSCGNNQEEKKAENAGKGDTLKTTTNETVDLPAPYATKSSSLFSKVIGWPANKTPQAPEGFTVTKFASNLDNPRWIYAAPNGDIFVSEAKTDAGLTKKIKSALSGRSKSLSGSQTSNDVLLFRDTNHDGKPDLQTVFISDLNQPFGMLVLNGNFYVANTDGLLRFPYKDGDTAIHQQGKKILDLPAGGYNNHWTRNILASKDGKKIYVTVGSGSNVGENGMENEIRRANILQINPDGSGERIYASGLRNPQGMGWAPGTQTLWTSVNERDELGDDLVPDYLTSLKEDGFYGWPYSYWGQHEDPRLKDRQRPDLVKKAITPDVDLGSHTASLGLAFDENNSLPGKYSGGVFIGQHGSWNRSALVGYKVLFIPFQNGKPSGKPEPFLTGFIADSAQHQVYGRPVGVAFTKNGTLLVADDAANTIWAVTPNAKK